jgi:hypothetical protein
LQRHLYTGKIRQQLTGNTTLTLMIINFSVFEAVVTSGSDYFVATCPATTRLLSCGIDNSQKQYVEPYRRMEPISNTTCLCYDRKGMLCVAWCTTANTSGFEIKMRRSSGMFSVPCSSGKKVTGCHVSPVTFENNVWEKGRSMFPSGNGSGTYL